MNGHGRDYEQTNGHGRDSDQAGYSYGAGPRDPRYDYDQNGRGSYDANHVYENQQVPDPYSFGDPRRYEPDYSHAPRPDSNSVGNGSGYDHRNRQSHHYDSESDTQSEEERITRSSRKGHKKRSSRSKSKGRLDKAKENFSTSDRGVGAGLIGAVAGGLIAQETANRNGKGSIGATIAGLVIGGLAGNALENKYDK